MADHVLTSEDLALRGTLTQMIAERGHGPDTEQLAQRLGVSLAAATASLRRLHDAHALLLHPHACAPWVVHPFSLSPGSCWVRLCDDGASGPRLSGPKGYWTNCLYCGFGVSAALGCDAEITTRYGGEGETVRYRIKDGAPAPSDDVFHLSTPARQWWDNVIFACASFQPFRTEADADDWCARHRLPKGAVMTIPALWAFAADWYGDYLKQPWRKRSRAETQEVLARHGLTSAFWAI